MEEEEMTVCDLCGARCNYSYPVEDKVGDGYYYCKSCFDKGVKSGDIKEEDAW